MFFSRRDFLKTTMGVPVLMSLNSVAPNSLARAAMAVAPKHDDCNTVLVVIQLSGGNDGLNTVVPYGDDEYARNRPTLSLPPKDLHKIDSFIGFHPRMAAFMRLYKEGHLSIIQAVGYPNSDRSHDGAMQVWHTADPDQPNRQTGWLGRAADSIMQPGMTTVPAVFVGPIARPFGLNAEHAIIPSIKSANDLTIKPIQNESLSKHITKLPCTEMGDTLLSFLQESMSNANAMSKRIETTTGALSNAAGYPSFQLAGHLRTIAQLIRTDIGIRIFYAELGGGSIGGFDNHANQLGNHCALLHQLSESLEAFIKDLKSDKLLDRVLLMTISEFGRTVRENGRRGTGHGAAAPIFLAGGKLKSDIIGSHPSLTDLDKDGLKFHTDFRRVYATILDKWLGFNSCIVLGKQYEPLDILNV
jgi:uncharacterized protein (DUF1501 family)